MSNPDHERMQRILSKTKELFLQDAFSRTEALKTDMALWEQKAMLHQELGDRVYVYAHSLKGLAYTVGCHEVHRISELVDSYSIQHSGAWTEQLIEELLVQVKELFIELESEWRNRGVVTEGTA
ncbi:hypothetical protein [Paenibacillus sp. RC67]|uniref:hypothetical protein n=1 Tax=Paenibacillus sp. RC67 TaxID=3039392 RepID=UPI0024ADE956|nr:hypothetical protein [Paenibacillus sp. RC67]